MRTNHIAFLFYALSFLSQISCSFEQKAGAYLGQDVAQKCNNGVQDVDEESVDCGGTCPACEEIQVCEMSDDCPEIVSKNQQCWNNICHKRELQYIQSENISTSNFGYSLSLFDNILAISDLSERRCEQDLGEFFCEVNAVVYLYVHEQGQLSRTHRILSKDLEALPPADTTFHNPSYQLSLSDKELAIGVPEEAGCGRGINSDRAPNNCLHSGAIYLINFDSNGWSQQSYIKASNATLSQGFGSSIKLMRDMLIVSAPFESSCSPLFDGAEDSFDCPSAGAVYIFKKDNNKWTQQHYLKSPLPHKHAEFGNLIDFNESHLVVASTQDTSCLENGLPTESGCQPGTIHLFSRDNGEWHYVHSLKSPNETATQFGASISLSKQHLLIGSPYEQICHETTGMNCLPRGAAYLYQFNNNEWHFSQKLVGPVDFADTRFAESVSINAHSILIGDPGDSYCSERRERLECVNSGAVYLYQNQNNIWVRDRIFKSKAPKETARFGSKVVSEDSYYSIAAINEPGCSLGINGGIADDSCLSRGAIYHYTLEK